MDKRTARYFRRLKALKNKGILPVITVPKEHLQKAVETIINQGKKGQE